MYIMNIRGQDESARRTNATFDRVTDHKTIAEQQKTDV